MPHLPGKPGRPNPQRPGSRPGRPPARPHAKPIASKPGPAKPPLAKPAGGLTDWNGVADWYDGLVGDAGSEYHREVVIPGTVRMLGATKGDRVLDLACGQGVLCRALSAAGVAVTGVDSAVELIRAARERQAQAPAGCAPVEYVVGDARDVSFLPEGAFGAAACVLAVQNIHPLGGLLGGSARCLRAGGRLVLVMMHPAFRVPKASGWGWDAKAGVQFRRVDQYLLPRKVPITTHPGSAPGGYTWTFHKPISAYVRALRNAGLLVDAMEEWTSHKTSTSGPRAAAENAAREEVPMFLAIRAVKVAGLTAAEADGTH